MNQLTEEAPPAIHPLITRLEQEFSYPRLKTEEEVAGFLTADNYHCLFIPGDARRNLETTDAAVVLPEIRLAFGKSFDCAVIDDAIETGLREKHRALKTPGFLFFRGDEFLGSITRVRDWSDYVERIAHFLQRSPD